MKICETLWVDYAPLIIIMWCTASGLCSSHNHGAMYREPLWERKSRLFVLSKEPSYKYETPNLQKTCHTIIEIVRLKDVETHMRSRCWRRETQKRDRQRKRKTFPHFISFPRSSLNCPHFVTEALSETQNNSKQWSTKKFEFIRSRCSQCEVRCDAIEISRRPW